MKNHCLYGGYNLDFNFWNPDPIMVSRENKIKNRPNKTHHLTKALLSVMAEDQQNSHTPALHLHNK